MAPLAFAAPLMVRLLDRSGFRRADLVRRSAERAVVAVIAAPNFDTVLLFPFAFLLLVAVRVHAITKNSLTIAYAPNRRGAGPGERPLSRVAAAGALSAAPLGFVLLKLGAAGR